MNAASPKRRRLIQETLRRAATSPPSLALTAAAAVLATHPVTWIPAGILAVASAGVIFWQLRNPDYIRRVSAELHRDQWRESLARAEDLQRVLDPHTSAALASLVSSQERLLALSAEASTLVPSHSQAADLMAHCLKLVEKRLQLEGFLTDSRAADLDREVERLEAQVAAAADPLARQLFEQALAQKRSEIDNLGAIQNAIARIDGQLAAVDATFDNLVGRIVRFRTTEAAQQGQDEAYVLQEMDHLTKGVATVEASLGEVLQLGGGR